MARLIGPAPLDGLGAGYHSLQVSADARLNTNESPFAPPARWADELVEAVRAIEFHRYPDRGYRELRSALANFHGVRPDQIFCANGSNEVIQTLFLTYGGPGRRVAVFEPTYALHSHIARLTRTEVVTGRRAEDFTIDFAELDRIVSASPPDLTFLCSPNNPTGRAESRSTVEATMSAIDGMLIVDEAYGQFAAWSALELVDDESPVVVVRTFSKTWSMAAARLGYLVGPSSVVAELDQRVLPYHLDSVKQAAGTLALGHVKSMEESMSAVIEERGRLSAGLSDLPVDTWPSEANFILFRPRPMSGDDVWQALVERSVLVRNCASWPFLDGCLRVTVGTPDENTSFLAALQEILSP